MTAAGFIVGALTVKPQQILKKMKSLLQCDGPKDYEHFCTDIRIVSDPANPSERGVMSNDNKLIAILGYYKPWREWVFYPQPNTVWSTHCLAAINAHLAVLAS